MSRRGKLSESVREVKYCNNADYMGIGIGIDGLINAVLELYELVGEIAVEVDAQSLEIGELQQQVQGLLGAKAPASLEVNYLKGERMANQSVTIPPGPNVATVTVLDANGNNITSTCTITAVSSDPAVVIGVITGAAVAFTASETSATPTIAFTATNSAGNVVETDTLTISVTAPASMSVAYQDEVLPSAAAVAAKKAAAVPENK